VKLDGGVATVLIGTFSDVTSPARRDSDHMAVDIDLTAGRTVVPLESEFEHAVIVLDGQVAVSDRQIGSARLGYLGPGRDELVIDTARAARVLLLGGIPFPEPLVMWWNYVARTREEITTAHQEWSQRSGRFGPVRSPLARIDIPGPPWAA
jgi:redox-sensitive bicupin YhaK (pirin superfamily)